MNGRELMSFYEKDKHLGRFLHIIKDKYVAKVRSGVRHVLHLLPLDTYCQRIQLQQVRRSGRLLSDKGNESWKKVLNVACRIVLVSFCPRHTANKSNLV